MKKVLFRASVFAMCSLLVSCGNVKPALQEGDVLYIHPDRVVRSGLNLPIGINLNYLRDSNENRKDARRIQDALKDMGAMHVRYPGGEKSDWLIWPEDAETFDAPLIAGFYEAQAAGYGLLGFDEYISTVREIGGIPYIVVGYDSLARTGITREQYLKSAVEWVRYANITKKYNIKYWEIGNENWNNNTGGPVELAEVVSSFSREMKKVDPSIKVGASGNSTEWWRDFLPQAAEAIDFLVVSQYSCIGWKGYDYYVLHPEVDLTGQAEMALDAIEKYIPDHKDRLKVVVAELNSADFGETAWRMDNTLGHALVTFEIIGQMLKNNRIEYGMLWNTRWLEDANPSEIWYALGTKNELLPPGRVLSIWGSNLRDQLVDISRTDTIVSFCTKDSVSGDLSVFLLNKSSDSKVIKLEISKGKYKDCKMYRFSGDGPEDTSPLWTGPEVIQLDGNMTDSFELTGVSITVLNMKCIR